MLLQACKTLGHSTLTCTIRLKPRSKKRSHETLTCSASSCPSAKTATVEKQEPYCAGPSVVPQVDPMSTEVATTGALRPQSPGRKRSKATATELSGSTPPIHHSEAKATAVVAPPTRQYLTRSKAATIPCLGLQMKFKALAVVFQSLYISDDSAPSSIFWWFVSVWLEGWSLGSCLFYSVDLLVLCFPSCRCPVSSGAISGLVHICLHPVAAELSVWSCAVFVAGLYVFWIQCCCFLVQFGWLFVTFLAWCNIFACFLLLQLLVLWVGYWASVLLGWISCCSLAGNLCLFCA